MQPDLFIRILYYPFHNRLHSLCTICGWRRGSAQRAYRTKNSETDLELDAIVLLRACSNRLPDLWVLKESEVDFTLLFSGELLCLHDNAFVSISAPILFDCIEHSTNLYFGWCIGSSSALRSAFKRGKQCTRGCVSNQFWQGPIPGPGRGHCYRKFPSFFILTLPKARRGVVFGMA